MIKPNTDEHIIKKYGLSSQRPYPGLSYFREDDKNYFFGRQKEIEELAELLDDNVLTLIFGKSGIGKTSLLRAGLIPYLRDRYYLPVYLRIDFDDQQKSPLDQVKEEVYLKIKELDNKAAPSADLTLWEYFHKFEILKGFVKPLLFFDQFEEIFTPGEKVPQEVNEFITEIADLIENRVPVTVQSRLKKNRQMNPYPGGELHYRVILSLREDYLPQLEMLYKYIPSLRYSRYRVAQMKGENALEAILKPGKEIIKNTDVAIEIIEKIPESRDADYSPYEEKNGSWGHKKIEPFLLSLFCYEINEKRLAVKAGEITGKLLADVKAKDIIGDFYEKNISKFDANVKMAAEELLLTAEGRRRLEEMSGLKTGYNVTDNDIEGLVDRRIIRKETRNGIEYVELIHDVLAPILKESREQRKEAEKRKKSRRIIMAAAAAVIIVLAGLLLYLFHQQASFEQQKTIAEEEARKQKAYELAIYSANLLEAKNKEIGFRLAQAAYERKPDSPNAYKALLNVYYNGGFCGAGKIRQLGAVSSTAGTKQYDFFAAYSPDGRRVLTLTSDKAQLWNLDRDLAKQDGEYKPGQGLELRPNAAFSPDGKYIAFCTKKTDKIIVLWNLATDEKKQLPLEADVNSVVFSPDSQNILTANRDNKIRLCDLNGGTIRSFEGHLQEVVSAVFSPDGTAIVSAGWDKTVPVRLWNLSSNKETNRFPHSGIVNIAVFAPDGRHIVTGSQDGIVRLLDSTVKEDTGRIIGVHKQEVKTVAFSPDGKYILSGSEDKTVRLWNLKGFPVFEFNELNGIIRGAEFSPDGQYILTAAECGPAQLRLMDPGKMIAQIESLKVRPLTADEKKTYGL
ncbi:MAG: WD40 repeat domain-containing protein [Candidatus Aminicenantes bacterium]|nr:WD40 repeat domain-containing protein [Candidatus Aminicenantes bacterium]